MKIDYSKYADGLIPAIVQDDRTGKVLMLGFMNEEALNKTQELAKVTFYSRSKKRLWTKGEESGNFLDLKSITPDCDNDTLLVKAIPRGLFAIQERIRVSMKRIQVLISFIGWKK